MKKILLLFFLLNFSYSFAQYNYDVKFYKINITVDPAIKYISGNVTTYFVSTKNNLSKVNFDFSQEMNVDSVMYHQQKINFSRQQDTLTAILPCVIDLKILDSITVYYHGVPPSSGFGAFVTDYQFNTPIMWTLSEPYGAKDWWPCKQTLTDKADSVDMIVKTPLQYSVASNGLLKSIDTAGTEKITHWHSNYPIATYLIAFAVTDYSSYYDYANIGDTINLPILEMVYPEDLSWAKQKSPDIIGSLKFYCDSFMLYPFWKEKYGQAMFGWGGGMENQTMTFITNFDHDLTAHELAHQWFGDYITCGSWHDIWLNEGFAVFLEGLTAEAGLADYSYLDWKKNCIQIGTAQKGGSVYVDDTTTDARIFNYSLTYMKGGMLLEMLRWILGDKNFFKGIRAYLHDPKLAYGFARVNDLKQHLEASADTNLTEFFNDWYYGQGFPYYCLIWSQKDKNELKITVSQTQSVPSVQFFDMKLPVKVVGLNNKDSLIVLNNTFNNQTFTIKTNFYVKDIIFDPDLNIFTINPQIFHIIDPSEQKLKIFPNPVTNNKINIVFNYPRHIKKLIIYDIRGVIISYKEFNNYDKNISLKNLHLSTGTYILNVETEEDTLNTYFIKQ